MGEIKICIGIISYLPDDEESRVVRVQRLKKLLNRCEANFKNLPIIIIAQNWKDGEISLRNNVTTYMYDRLGITLARETLRKTFLENTDYDYIICFDDDFELKCEPTKSRIYLNYLMKNPGCIIEYENYLMNFCAISREIYKNNPYNLEVDPERGTGFEDWVWISLVKRKNKEKARTIKGLGIALKKRSELVNDKYSTWITENTDKVELDRKSWNLIEEGTKGNKKPKLKDKEYLF